MYHLFVTGGRGSHSVAKGSFVNLSCAWVGLVLVPQMCFCFVGLPFFPSACWPLSFPSLFHRPCLIHAQMPDNSRAFVHGHTFLHPWSGPMTLEVGLLHGVTFLFNLLLFSSCLL